MRRLFVILIVIAILAIATPTLAQSPEAPAAALAKGDVASYVVLMADSAVLGYEGGLAKYQATSPRAGEKIDVASADVKAYAGYLVSTHDMALRAAGVSRGAKVHDYTYALNGFSALLTAEQAEALGRQPGVIMVKPDEMRYIQTENTPSFLGLNAPRGAWAKGITGEGVVVGVIDTGIWPEHASFADDGSYGPSPLGPLPCEFGDTAHNPDDAPFDCNNKLLGARDMMFTYHLFIGPEIFNSARDDDGHGTHTASTAAGNAGVAASIFGIDRGIVSGIAPRARIVAYKGCGSLGCFGSDLTAAIDQAVADGVDVINYSIGGGASLTGSDDIAFLFAADAGVFVATSAGNSGPGAGTVGGPASVPWITAVGASTHDRTFEGSASSSDGWEFFGASITGGTAELPLVDSVDAGSELCIPGALDPADVAGNIVLCRRGAIARAAKSQAVAMAGGVGMILYNASDTQSEVTDNHSVPSVHINNTDGLVIKGYIAADPDPTAMINGGVAVSIPAPWMADFSSRGPDSAALDIIKPDVTAPGVNVLAGASPIHFNATAQGELFQSISGTSMSSPHVAGVFALIKQLHPDWTAAMAKSALMTTAYQDVMKEDGATPADPFDFGAGHIDPSGNPLSKNTPFNPGLVYEAGFLEYLGFLCTAAPEVFANPEATCALLVSLGIPTDPSDLNLPSIGIADLTGSQTVQRTVTQLAKRSTYRVSVEAPPGYTVEVHPSVLRLVNGDTATYHVTITNDGTGAVGQWSFGSLTWTSGGYSVRSPIAVRGALFDAPAEISGSGESGAVSFDVGFGYTGSYSAAAHGLEPATVTSDVVVQDPDQSFDPNDGYSNLHQFILSGAAFFRIAMPVESVADPAIDLDIYVYDPGGTLVASSTSGSTNELVDILLPADGTWSVYVHGWQTAGPSAAYDMYSWVVSATPGGNMTIDSAPASATIGATGTVDASWTGASAGQWHLGAVSHTGDVGLMGLTLVDVDNR